MNFKKENKKIDWLFLSSIFLFFLVLVNIFNQAFFLKDYYTILWYCDVATILLSVGIWLKNKNLITVIFVTAVAAQFKWIYGFLSGIFLGRPGMTEWLFDVNLWVASVSVLMHFLLIPIAFWGILKYGFGKKSIFYIFIFTILLLVLSYFLSPIENNINCVFRPCEIEPFDLLVNMKNYFNLKYLFSEIYSWLFYYSISFLILYLIFTKFFKK